MMANDDLLGTVASGEAMFVTFRLASSLVRMSFKFYSVFYLLLNFDAASRLTFILRGILRAGFFGFTLMRIGDSLIVCLSDSS